jgi:hypothetical protein
MYRLTAITFVLVLFEQTSYEEINHNFFLIKFKNLLLHMNNCQICTYKWKMVKYTKYATINFKYKLVLL